MRSRIVLLTYLVVGGLATTMTTSPAFAVCKKKTTGYFQLLETANAAPAARAALGNLKQIANSLTSQPGNADRGRAIVIDRKKGNCLACHRVAVLKKELFHGEIGPRLDGVGRKYSDGQLRQFLVDSRVFNPRTLMPSFYIKTGFNRVMPKFRGKY